jgi:hypothetical protein
MTPEEEKRYQEVVLMVACRLAHIAPPYNWEQYTKDWPDLAKYHFQRAGELLSLPGIRIEDADQSLPENPYTGEQYPTHPSTPFRQGQKSMAGFVRVLPREDTINGR